MILANRAPGDNQVIYALGDMLKKCGWIHAAHVWYVIMFKKSKFRFNLLIYLFVNL